MTQRDEESHDRIAPKPAELRNGRPVLTLEEFANSDFPYAPESDDDAEYFQPLGEGPSGGSGFGGAR